MLERTLWLATFALLLTGGVLLWRRYLEQQTKRLAFAQIPTELAALPLASGPAVLYFTTHRSASARGEEVWLRGTDRDRLWLRIGSASWWVNSVEKAIGPSTGPF